MSFEGFLDKTWDELITSLFPNESSEYIDKITRIASCLQGGGILEKLQAAAALVDSTPSVITKLLTDNTEETWEFNVVAGRHGSISTAVDGAAIDAASTISIEYSLVASPGANDWKVYTDGLFTGDEVDKEIVFVGVINRVVWTPNANENLNVMVAL